MLPVPAGTGGTTKFWQIRFQLIRALAHLSSLFTVAQDKKY